MWNEAISAFSKQFEDACGMWILLTKYTADVYRGNIFPPIFFPLCFKFYIFFIYKGIIGVKLYKSSSISKVDQDDERVIARKKKLSEDLITELDGERGKTASGQILFFPEASLYRFYKCHSCQKTTPIRGGKMEVEMNICGIDGCFSELKSCYKVDVKFIVSGTSEVIHLTGFDQVLSPYEAKGDCEDPLEVKFKKLMGTPLTVFYKSSFKRKGSDEPSHTIESIRVERV